MQNTDAQTLVTDIGVSQNSPQPAKRDERTASIFDLLSENRQPEINEENEMANENEMGGENIGNPRYKWILEKTFQSKAECEAFIESEECWKSLHPVNTRSGIKTYYRCIKTKYRGARCSASIYTKHNQYPGDLTYQLYRKVAEHDHEGSTNKVNKVSEEVKAFIKEGVSNSETLKTIRRKLRDKEGIAQPTTVQIESIIKQARKELFGDSKIILEDFIKFCEKNSEPPEDEDTAFILAYEHTSLDPVNIEITTEENHPPDQRNDEGDDDIMTGGESTGNIDHRNRSEEDFDDYSEDDEPVRFRFIVSTKRLLRNSINSKIIHSDATHKMTIQKYPILVFGTTDQDYQQHFHLIGIMVTKGETAADFAFGFNAIKKGMLLVEPETVFKPNILMADASAAIGNGFKQEFPEYLTILMCFFHLMQAIDRRKLADNANKKDIKNDIQILKKSSSKSLFDTGSRLFIDKWKAKDSEFAEYFKRYWLDRNQNWYNGAAFRAPKTNNGLEGFNGNMKIHDTFFKRRGLAEFKVRLLEVITNRSKEYRMDKAPFQLDIGISKNVMKEGERLSKFMTYKHKVSEDGEKAYCYMKGKGYNDTPLSDDAVNAFLNSQPKDFAEFGKNLDLIHCITFGKEASDWRNASCTCDSFAKCFICKHVICMAFILKLLPEKKQKILESNVVGRPNLGTGALTRD